MVVVVGLHPGGVLVSVVLVGRVAGVVVCACVVGVHVVVVVAVVVGVSVMVPVAAACGVVVRVVVCAAVGVRVGAAVHVVGIGVVVRMVVVVAVVGGLRGVFVVQLSAQLVVPLLPLCSLQETSSTLLTD